MGTSPEGRRATNIVKLCPLLRTVHIGETLSLLPSVLTRVGNMHFSSREQVIEVFSPKAYTILCAGPTRNSRPLGGENIRSHSLA